jgi:hypothetical protein
MPEPTEILAVLENVRAGTLSRCEGLTQEQLDWMPPVVPSDNGESSWSLGEVFMHLAIDEHYLREQIARPLLEGVQPSEGLSFLPPPPPFGTPKEVIRHWFERARLMTRRLIADWLAGANLTLKHTGGLEPMNGAEWLMGYGGHEAFHHRQIDTLLAQLSLNQAENV